MDIPNLHYIDFKHNSVKSVPYSRDRALSVSPLFYPNERAALIALQSKLHEQKSAIDAKLEQISDSLSVPGA